MCLRKPCPQIAKVTLQPSFALGNPVPLSRGGALGDAIGERAVDLMPDGQRFIAVVRANKTPAAPQIQVVLNWSEELKQRVPTK